MGSRENCAGFDREFLFLFLAFDLLLTHYFNLKENSIGILKTFKQFHPVRIIPSRCNYLRFEVMSHLCVVFPGPHTVYNSLHFPLFIL